MEIVYKHQKELNGLVCFLIKSPNLSKISKVLKKDSKFKVFAVKYIQDMVKNKMTAVVSNSKLIISSSKISPNVIERFFILTINNKYTRSALILQFILRALAGSIGVSGIFYQGVKKPDANNKSNESETEIEIKLEDKIN